MLRSWLPVSKGHSAFSTFHHGDPALQGRPRVSAVGWRASFTRGCRPASRPSSSPRRRTSPVIQRELEALGAECGMSLKRPATLQCLDAPALLETFMVGGKPDPERFKAGARELLRAARRGRDEATVYVYGEMVDLLWQAGDRDGGAAPRGAVEPAGGRGVLLNALRLCCGRFLPGPGPRGPLRTSHPRGTRPPGARPVASAGAPLKPT